MARTTNRDFWNSLGAMFGRAPRTPTNPAAAPATGPAESLPAPTPENPAAGLPWNMFPSPDPVETESVPVAATANYGSNDTPNDQTWSNPNADTAAYTEDAGFGRVDAPIGSSATQASGYVRTNISPGGSAGGISTVPSPMRLPGDTVKVMPGDTLKTLAQRSMGDPSFWPRLHVIQNDYVVKGGSAGDMVLKAGTVLPIN